MGNVHIKTFSPSDTYKMHFRDQKEYKNLIEVMPDYFEKLDIMSQKNAYTIYKDNEIIAITGWVPTIMNFCQIWFFAAENLDEKFNKEVYLVFKLILEKVKQKWERIETTCIENKRNKKFLKKLGFKQECLMKKYGMNGEDMYLYSIVKE